MSLVASADGRWLYRRVCSSESLVRAGSSGSTGALAIASRSFPATNSSAGRWSARTVAGSPSGDDRRKATTGGPGSREWRRQGGLHRARLRADLGRRRSRRVARVRVHTDGQSLVFAANGKIHRVEIVTGAESDDPILRRRRPDRHRTDRGQAQARRRRILPQGAALGSAARRHGIRGPGGRQALPLRRVFPSGDAVGSGRPAVRAGRVARRRVRGVGGLDRRRERRLDDRPGLGRLAQGVGRPGGTLSGHPWSPDGKKWCWPSSVSSRTG